MRIVVNEVFDVFRIPLMSLFERHLACLNRSFIKFVAWDTNWEFLLTRIWKNYLVILVIRRGKHFEVEKSVFKLLVQVVQVYYVIFRRALFL